MTTFCRKNPHTVQKNLVIDGTLQHVQHAHHEHVIQMILLMAISCKEVSYHDSFEVLIL